MDLRIASVFSGVGGIDLGFEQHGFKTVFATDYWSVACNSIQLNFPESEVICDDIANIDFKKIKNKQGGIDGLVGGPPCPPFSKSRFYIKEKKRGIDDIDGYTSIINYFRALEELDPKFFFDL